MSLLNMLFERQFTKRFSFIEAIKTVLNIFHVFLQKIRLDISCKSSARQRLHMKHQAIISSAAKSKNIKVSSASILLASLRVKPCFSIDCFQTGALMMDSLTLCFYLIFRQKF